MTSRERPFTDSSQVPLLLMCSQRPRGNDNRMSVSLYVTGSIQGKVAA